MTDQEKQLLLKDLAARVPYGIMVDQSLYPQPLASNIQRLKNVQANDCVQLYWKYFNEFISIDHIKPYLRPMSSMTEEERLELSRLTDDKFKFYLYTVKPEIVCYEKYNYLEGLKVLDWLNAHHFDYRRLIEKGLALEAPKNMYNI